MSENANPKILECISSISNGNIRQQLNLIYKFLISGQTKVDEYIWNYAKDLKGKIPFHEVLHSLILEDKKIFEEANGSTFMNIFEPGPSRADSHFTILRVLDYLHKGLGQLGELRTTDFVSLESIHAEFESLGLSSSDLEFHLKRMVEFGLLMPQSLGRTVNLKEERLALAKAGLYYSNTLFHEFAYYVSMACDTTVAVPMVHAAIQESLRKYSAEAKFPLEARVTIGKAFVNYLSECEKREHSGAAGRHRLFGGFNFVERIKENLASVERVGLN